MTVVLNSVDLTTVVYFAVFILLLKKNKTTLNV